MTIRGFHQLPRSSTTAANFYAACANALRHVAHHVCSFQAMVILDGVPVCRIMIYEFMQCIRYVLRTREATARDCEEVGAKITMRSWWCAKLHQDAYATQSNLDVEQTIYYSSSSLRIQPTAAVQSLSLLLLLLSSSLLSSSPSAPGPFPVNLFKAAVLGSYAFLCTVGVAAFVSSSCSLIERKDV
jgi:hypothetical protein